MRDEIDGLRTRKQIRRFNERQAARKARAEARAAEAYVRHLNFELVMRIVLLGLTVAGWLLAILGGPDDPTLAKLAYVAAGIWTAIAAALVRTLRPKRDDEK